MILLLEVTGPEAEKLGAAQRKEFHASGGSVGRLPDNSWVLPDPYVSSRHALIRYQGGAFYIEDTSTNGVFINSPDNRLVAGQPHALKSGDWIFIDPYEIRAVITAKDATPVGPGHDDPFGLGGSTHQDPPYAGPGASTPQDPHSGSYGGLFDQAAPYASASPLEPLIPGTGDDVDPLSLLGFERKAGPTPNVPVASDLARGSVLSEHYQPPPARPVAPPAPSHGSLIPDDYDPLSADDPSGSGPLPRGGAPSPRPPVQRAERGPSPAPPSVPAADPFAGPAGPGLQPPAAAQRPARVAAVPTHEPFPVPAHGAAQGHGVAQGHSAAPAHSPAAGRDVVGLEAMLVGAGLNGVAVTPELAHAFGEILRVVVSGVMEVLQARQRIKDEFRMRMTSFRPAANNPLKFSANVDDALHNLLVKRNAAYLGPVEAFEDAFDDLRNHQVATLAGVRVAFEAMLAEFDPDRLQADFDQQLKKGSLISVPGRLRYWDLYRDRFSGMVRDPDTAFRELFGDEFTKAYEEQLDRLKAQGRRGPR